MLKSHYVSHQNGFLLAKLMQWFYNIDKATNKPPEIVAAVILKKAQSPLPDCHCLESCSGLSCLHFLVCENHSLAGCVLIINDFCLQ